MTEQTAFMHGYRYEIWPHTGKVMGMALRTVPKGQGPDRTLPWLDMPTRTAEQPA